MAGWLVRHHQCWLFLNFPTNLNFPRLWEKFTPRKFSFAVSGESSSKFQLNRKLHRNFFFYSFPKKGAHLHMNESNSWLSVFKLGSCVNAISIWPLPLLHLISRYLRCRSSAHQRQIVWQYWRRRVFFSKYSKQSESWKIETLVNNCPGQILSLVQVSSKGA